MDSSPVNSAPTTGSLRTLFGNRAFSWYVVGATVSMTGTWMQQMAQGWVMTSLTKKAVMLGMVNFAAGIPMIALSMVGGVCADRYSKRNILLLCQVLQIACAAFLGWLIAHDLIQIWHVIGVAFFLGIAAAFELPAAAAFLPELAGKEHIATAISIERAIFHGTRLIGPALAGLVIASLGNAAAFYANALSFVAFMVALYTMPARPVGVHDPTQPRRGIREGFAYVRQDRPTLAMIGLLAASVVFVFPILAVMMPLYARELLLLGPDKMGLLMGLSAVGGLTGSVGLVAVARHQRRPLLFSAVIGIGLGLVGLGLARQFALAAGSLIGLSLGISTLGGLTNIIVQERAPGPMRGRVSAIVGLSFFGLMPFAGLGLTSLADTIGIRQALFVAAGAYCLLGLGVLLGPGRHLRDPNPQP